MPMVSTDDYHADGKHGLVVGVYIGCHRGVDNDCAGRDIEGPMWIKGAG